MALFRCGGCKLALYCSTGGQKKDWRDTHKVLCNSMRCSTDGELAKKIIDLVDRIDTTVQVLRSLSLTTILSGSPISLHETLKQHRCISGMKETLMVGATQL